MQKDNFFQILSVKKCLIFVYAIQLAFWGSVGLDIIGINFPVLRQVVGIVYLLFVPGFLILRSFRLKDLETTVFIIYSLGLSISFLIFTGLLMNFLCPLIGFFYPISLVSLTIAISIQILLLSIIFYLCDKSPQTQKNKDMDISFGRNLAPYFLLLLPLLAIYGTYSLNYQSSNYINMAVLILIVLLVCMVALNVLFSSEDYPLIIFIISMSLLLMNSLVSEYLWGWDVHIEYYLSNLVLENSFWDWSYYSNVNSMLSIVILAPTIVNLLDVSLVSVFKIIYPCIYSVVPVGLYIIYQKQTSSKIAFYAVFFFMSQFIFFTEMLQLARQQIAELYLVLMILLLIDKRIEGHKKSLLLIIFAFSLAVSHYGLSYIFMGSLVFITVMFFIESKINPQRDKNSISLNFTVLYISFIFSWYMFVSSSSPFDSAIKVTDHIYSSLLTDVLNSETSQGLAIIGKEMTSLSHELYRYIHLLSQVFISIGIISTLIKFKDFKFTKEYFLFSIINYLLLIACIVIPFFASALHITRLYHISLYFLSPFCIIGVIEIFNFLSKHGKIDFINNSKISTFLLTIFLCLFFLFNTGFIFEVTNDRQTSISLNDSIDYPLFTEKELYGVVWLNNERTNSLMYGDIFRYQLLKGFNFKYSRILPLNRNQLPRSSYLFLGKFNVENKKFLFDPYEKVASDTFYNDYSPFVSIKNEIYNNGGSQIYY